jgi:hypothetical protein
MRSALCILSDDVVCPALQLVNSSKYLLNDREVVPIVNGLQVGSPSLDPSLDPSNLLR